jgi:UDP-glucose 4-epimerase
MKILITGTSGFIGTRLLRAVCEEYGSTNVIALSTTPKSQCETILYDPLDFSISRESLEKIGTAGTLLHAGAYTPKSSRDANFLPGCNGNISFTDKLLSSRLADLQRILYLSTIDVYAPADLISESTPTLPASLYGLSKLYCESMVACYAAQRGITSQILRIGHVFGPGEETYQKFLPVAIRRILRGEDVELWGNGAELRSLIYIDDVISAILAALRRPETASPVNVVSGRALSIRSILDQLIAISGGQGRIVRREAPTKARDYVFDNFRLRTNLLAEETDFNAALRAEYLYFKALE